MMQKPACVPHLCASEREGLRDGRWGGGEGERWGVGDVEKERDVGWGDWREREIGSGEGGEGERWGWGAGEGARIRAPKRERERESARERERGYVCVVLTHRVLFQI